jgi:nucleotide-binding universal stress UspA family protein
MKKFSKILVPTDYSKTSKEALLAALEFCREFKAQLRVLHVVEVGMYGMYGPEAFWTSENIDNLRRSASAEMDRFLKSIDQSAVRDVTINGHVEMSSKRAADTIDEDAQNNNVDLIVMTTHGRSGLDHLIMGSVAERLVRIARCPILTMKVQEEGKWNRH